MSSPASLSFSIAASVEGVVADGFEFKLAPLADSTVSSIKKGEQKDSVKKHGAAPRNFKKKPASLRGDSVSSAKGRGSNIVSPAVVHPEKIRTAGAPVPANALPVQGMHPSRARTLPSSFVSEKQQPEQLSGRTIHKAPQKPVLRQRTAVTAAWKMKPLKVKKRLRAEKDRKLSEEQELLKAQLLRLLQEKQKHYKAVERA